MTNDVYRYRILFGDEAKREFGHLTKRDAKKQRQQEEEARTRIEQYMEEHRGCLLALDIFTGLYNRYGRD